jgi:RimJ/RimL family protein N-acetyltransferase
MDVTLRTARLELRRFTIADLGALDAVFGDPEVMRYVGERRAPWSPDEIRAALTRVDAHWAAHGFGPLAVITKRGGELLGECGLQLLEEGPDVELAYTFARRAWGRGYATEAAGAVLAWGFGVLGLTRVVGVTSPENAASRRVLEKAGMRRLGRRRCYGAELLEFALEAPAGAPADGVGAGREPGAPADGEPA